ncbi:UvrB/UvrC motif-containing protein [bacterium]|nr:UvrB/UvrC motif-containing protein [bacterium]MBU2462221.1 UvrB/UvrC motif-containing protein [bacterium]
MVCDKCRANEANIHFKQVINNQSTTMHLCESCAEEIGFNLFSGPSAFPFFNILSGMMGTPAKPQIKEDKCPGCGISFSEVQSKGKLGCSDCWQTFKKQLLPFLKEMQGDTFHIGKSPKGFAEKVETNREMVKMREELNKAIAKEEYEESAKIRDKIKEMERSESAKSELKKEE